MLDGSSVLFQFLVTKRLQDIISISCAGHRGNTVLHFAAQNGRIDLMKYIIDNAKEKVNRKNDYSETPLHLAAACHSMGNQ